VLGHPSHERPPVPDEATDGTDPVLPLGLHRCPGANALPRPCVAPTGSSPNDCSPQRCDSWGGALILMAWWYERLGIRFRASVHAPLRLHDLGHTAASLAIEACAHREADPSTPRSPRRSTDTATSCPAWTRRSPRKWMGSDGRLSSEGIARDAMTHIRWGRVLEHAPEIGRVTVKPPSSVAFQGRDRSTHNAPLPRGCCRGTLARGYALTSSEPRRRRR
jgi:hypothetical protein